MIKFYPEAKDLIRKVVLILVMGMEMAWAQTYNFKNYNVTEGLTQSQVYDIIQDRRGFLWMGTAGGGISVFDGSQFRNFSVEDGLKSNEVSSILEDAQGRMWFGHDEGGLTMYDGNAFRIYRGAGGVRLEGLTILCAATQGGFWVGTQGSGARYFDGKKFTALTEKEGLPSDSVRDIVCRADGETYIGTEEGLVRMQNGKPQTVRLRGLPESPRITSLMFDRDDHLMFSHAGGLYVVQGDSAIAYPDVGGIGVINDIFQDHRGWIWLAGMDQLSVLRPDGFHRFQNEEGLWQTGTYVAMEDNYGNVWIGTEGGGASCYSEEPWTLYGKGTPIDQRAVFGMVEVGPEYYWIGTERGLFELRGDSFSAFNDPLLSEATIFNIIKTRDNSIYVTGSSGIFRCNSGKCKQIGVESRLGDNGGFMAVEDRDSSIWVANQAGVFVIEGDAVIELSKQYPALGRSTAQIMIDSKGQRWFVFMSQGLLRWKQGDRLISLNLPENFSNNRALTIAEDANGHVWVGTRNGLLRWGNNSCYLTAQEGLLGGVIYVLQPDLEGNLWVGTERGLNRVILNHDSEVMDIKVYGQDEGFRGQECNQGSGYIDSKGRFWVGTIYGLCRFDPKHDLQPDILPKLHLSGLKLDLEDVDWKDLGFEVQPWTHMPVNLELAPNQNHLRFEFKATTMWRPDNVRYRYILEGLEEHWSKPAAEAYATYPALPPGSYTFKVMAADASGRWTEAIGFSFKISAPFYTTAWFILGSILFVFAMLFLGFRIRLRNANRIRARLERKVKERTEELENANRVKGEFLAKMSHEIRTPMNGVIGMTDLLRRTVLDDRQRKFVENIRVSGQNLLSLINDILDFSRIESGKMELESTAIDVRSMIEEVLDILAYGAYNKGLELLVWIDPEIRGPILGDPARLKQIVLNLVGNAVKFTPSGRITVTAELKERGEDTATIVFCIKDSGIGIPKEKHGTLFESFTQVDASTTRKYGGTGLGLAISYNLARMMGGDMWVESEHGQGASFFFTIQAGLSAPWKTPAGDHPAANIQHKLVGAAIADPEARMLLSRYLEHWKVQVRYFDSIELLTDALLEREDLDFFIIDARMFPEGASAQSTTKHFALACKRRSRQFALFCEPSLAVDLQGVVGDQGWLVPKPWKRDDLLRAMLGDRLGGKASGPYLEHDGKLATQMPLDILIAEDNPINVEVAVGMLRNFGYAARVAEDGLEALAALEERMPDVVFMDVQMPRMDGLQATAALIEKYGSQRPKVIAMTANAMESDRQRCIAAGMDNFISKPFVAEELVQMLHWVAGRLPEETAVVAEELPEEVVAMGAEALEPVIDNHRETVPDRLLDLTMLEAASGGDPMFVTAILTKLAVKMPEAIDELRAALSRGEWDTVRAVAHRTKSSAAYTGVEDLRLMFRDMEHAAMDEVQRASLPGRLDAVEVMVKQIVGEIKVVLAG